MNSRFMKLILNLLGQNEQLGIVVEGRLVYLLQCTTSHNPANRQTNAMLKRGIISRNKKGMQSREEEEVNEGNRVFG